MGTVINGRQSSRLGACEADSSSHFSGPDVVSFNLTH